MKSFFEDERGEFNYVRWIIVLALVAGGYWGWKYGPGLMQKYNMQRVANKCAALANIKQDSDVKPEIIKMAGAEAHVAINDQSIVIDRSMGAHKTCSISWQYNNTQIWGSPIVKAYSIVGESAVK